MMGRLWEGGCLSGGDLVWQLGSEWSLLDSAYDKVLDPRWGLAGLCGGILYIKWHVLLVLSGMGSCWLMWRDSVPQMACLVGPKWHP